jgi:hypothetical protein
VEKFSAEFLEVLVSRSILDGPEDKPEVEGPSLAELADMLFTVFSAVRDVEDKLDVLLEAVGALQGHEGSSSDFRGL